MRKIYSVVIKGRTLESNNLKELLAHAVNAKRNFENKLYRSTDSYRQPLNNPGASVRPSAMI